jgi:putative ABC transport system ATP-binding protein
MINIENMLFSYRQREFSLKVDKLMVNQGESLAIVGPSGTGKTTLLNLIAGVLLAEQGKVEVLGQRLSQLSEAQRRRQRIQNIGMIFQNFELIPYLSVLDNVLLATYLEPRLKSSAALKARARQLLAEVGLSDKVTREVTQLSQGEQQRVAICRALLLEPPLLLADEPTGNLDMKNKAKVLDILLEQSKALKAGLIMVTHDLEQVEHFDRVLDFETFQHEVA